MKPLTILLLAATMSLAAEGSDIGVRAHLLVPASDLHDMTDGQLGLGAALFVSIPATPSLVIRPLVGFQYIPEGDTLGLMGTKTSVSSMDVMVDGLWFPDEDPTHGAYLIGSVGLQQWRIKASGTTNSNISYGRLGANAGLGYQYSPRLGFELRGFWSPIDDTIKATGLLVCATVKF